MNLILKEWKKMKIFEAIKHKITLMALKKLCLSIKSAYQKLSNKKSKNNKKFTLDWYFKGTAF